MWVLRAGKNGIYVDRFLAEKRIYICWDGYDTDLSKLKSHDDFVIVGLNEEHNTTKVALINRISQLEYFCDKMEIGDYVLLPKSRSASFALVKVTGNYEYQCNHQFYCHSRTIEIVLPDINGNIFPQDIKYSLGAYRNLFHAKRESEIVMLLNEHYGINIGDDANA